MSGVSTNRSTVCLAGPDGTLAPRPDRSGVKATVSSTLVPILCGTALRNKGVQLLLDAVVAYLPSPLDVPPIKAIDPRTDTETTREVDPNGPASEADIRPRDVYSTPTEYFHIQ